jgi:hypothetical protein
VLQHTGAVPVGLLAFELWVHTLECLHPSHTHAPQSLPFHPVTTCYCLAALPFPSGPLPLHLLGGKKPRARVRRSGGESGSRAGGLHSPGSHITSSELREMQGMFDATMRSIEERNECVPHFLFCVCCTLVCLPCFHLSSSLTVGVDRYLEELKRLDAGKARMEAPIVMREVQGLMGDMKQLDGLIRAERQRLRQLARATDGGGGF